MMNDDDRHRGLAVLPDRTERVMAMMTTEEWKSIHLLSYWRVCIDILVDKEGNKGEALALYAEERGNFYHTRA